MFKFERDKLENLYKRAKQGEIIPLTDLVFIPDILDREYYYKSLLSFTLEYRKNNNLDTKEVEELLYSKKELEIKELEEKLALLKGVANEHEEEI